MQNPVPLLTYLFVMYVTPGPNNIMLTASGLHFGFRRTVVHMAGICLGVGVQLFLCALVLSSAGAMIERVRHVLALAGCAYLLFLSYRIACAGEPGRGGPYGPLGLFEAALFQNINPKAWVMVANAAVLFMPRAGGVRAALGLTLASGLVGLPCCALWAFGGDRLRRWLHRPALRRAFNLAMAGALAGTAIWLSANEWAGS